MKFDMIELKTDITLCQNEYNFNGCFQSQSIFLKEFIKIRVKRAVKIILSI
jgi:hypothetical protein